MMLEILPYMLAGGAVALTSSPVLFVVFFLLNEVINKTVKNMVRQPRPKDCAPYMRKSYGMPSGHSQAAGFAASFIWQEVTRQQQIVFVLATLATMVQRVHSNSHSVSQVLVGAAVGGILGLVSYTIVTTVKEKFPNQWIQKL